MCRAWGSGKCRPLFAATFSFRSNVVIGAVAVALAFTGCGSSGSGTDAGGLSFTGGGGGSSGSTGGGTAATGGGTAATGGGTAATGGGDAAAGGGTAATGGGTASTGGGTGAASCAVLPAFDATALIEGNIDDSYEDDGFFGNYAYYGRDAASGTSGNGDFLDIQFWPDSATPAIPLTAPLDPDPSCVNCAIFYEDCTASTCARTYVAATGTQSVTAFTYSADAGTFAGSISDVTFREVDDNFDLVADGGCFHLASQPFNATW